MSADDSEKQIRSGERAIWITAFCVAIGFIALFTAIVLAAGHFSTTDENDAAHAWKDSKPYGLKSGVRAVRPAMAVSAGLGGISNCGAARCVAFHSAGFRSAKKSVPQGGAFFENFRGLVPAKCVSVEAGCLVKTPAGVRAVTPAGCNREPFLCDLSVLPLSRCRVGEISRPRPVLKTLKGIPVASSGRI